MQSTKKTYIIFLMILSIIACNKDIDDIKKPNPNPEPTERPIIDTIYINNQADFDAYKTSEFTPGKSIFFAAGQVFTGQFAPTGSGTENKPIKLTAYNPETGEAYWDHTDNKPIINGQGLVNSGFYLYNGSNWEINNLEITNTNGSDADQGDLRGIHLESEDVGTIENVIIQNCYVHDVNGKVEGKERGGIHVHVIGNKKKTKYHNLRIENNHVADVGGVGIGNQSSWRSITSEDYTPWTNLVIRGNRVERTGRNGIIVRASIEPIVEYNILAYCSRYSTGHNVFNFNTRGCIIQYNESYGNTGDLDDHDRGGFDADYNSEDTYFQYNYSHDNHWFLGIMRKYNKKVTVRYNSSVNERLGAYEYGFPTDTGVQNVIIYNNTHYFGKGLNASPIASPGKTRTPIETTFYNNIFYFEDPSFWAVQPDESCLLSHNLYYNAAPLGEHPITTDPKFIDPGQAPTNIDMTDSNRLSGYQLQNSSPCIKAGLVIQENGGKDFWGNPIGTDKMNIGAHENQ